MDEMKLLQPNSNVQISRKTPLRFLKRLRCLPHLKRLRRLQLLT